MTKTKLKQLLDELTKTLNTITLKEMRDDKELLGQLLQTKMLIEDFLNILNTRKLMWLKDK